MSSAPVALIVPTAEELVLLQGLRAQTAAKLIPVKVFVNRGPVSSTLFNPIEDCKTKLKNLEATKAGKACDQLKAKGSDIHYFRKTKAVPHQVNIFL